MADYNTELRKRLKFLVNHFGQAEVARRTTTAPSTLSRYLRDTRIPAEFVARAVEALELRPSWLLHGEEPPFASAVTEKSAEMASNLLEIVRAMQATSRMRIGAVFGSSDLRKLDELNKALHELNTLRHKLRAEFEDQYHALLESVHLTLARPDMSGADRLLRAAEVFAELCPDEDLKGLLRSCQSYYELRQGRPEQALRPHSQLLYWTLGELGPQDKTTFRHAINHVMLLVRLERRPEALRVCRAFGALAEALPEGNETRIAFRGYEAFLQVRSGNIEAWLGSFLSAMNELRDSTLFLRFVGQYLSVLYLMGMGSLKQVWDMVPETAGAAFRALIIVSAMEDRAGLADALELTVGEGDNRMKSDSAFPRLARALLDRLEGGSAAAFRKAVLENSALLSDLESQVSRFHMQALLASFQRLAGKRQECLKTVRKYFADVAKGAGEFQPDVIDEAMQLRNLVLATGNPDSKECRAARERLTDLRRRGFRGLDRWASDGVFIQ